MAIYKFVEYWPAQMRLTRFPRKKTKARHFKAFSDSLLDTPDDVLAYPGNDALEYPACPQLSDLWKGPTGQIDPSDQKTYCTDLDIHQDGEHVHLFLIEASYSTDGPDQPIDPRDRPPEVEWTTIRQPRAIIQDALGRPLTNSATDYFNPPLEIEDDIDVLTYTRFELADDFAARAMYRGAVNKYVFLGFDPGQVKVQSIRSRDHWEYNFLWKHKTYEFHVKTPGSGGEPAVGFDLPDYSPWDYFVLDQGTRTFDRVNRKYKNIIDSRGNIITAPTLLNGGGQELRLAYTYLESGGITADAVNFEVTDLDGFPRLETNLDGKPAATVGDPDTSICPFWIRVDVGSETEYMRVTDMLTGPDRLVVTRGERGTIAREHAGAVLIKMEPYYFTYKIRKRLDFAEIAPDGLGGFRPIVLPVSP